MNYRLRDGLNNIHAKDFVYDMLNRRGIDMAYGYLHPTPEYLEDCFKLDHMRQGVELLHKHLEQGSKIFILPDADQDGYTSAAICWKYIKKIKPDANLYYKIHSKKQHGILLKYVEPGTNLVIIPDAGSNQFEEHKFLRDQGIDVLVIDHHEADHSSEDACIINNQLSVHYPNKFLSGAGVVYKFCQAYDKIYGYNYADEFLDLAAIGIIGDVMSLTTLENKYIIDTGLRNIHNVGIKALVAKQDYKIKNPMHVTPTEVSWYITPLVNSIVRMGKDEEKAKLFEILIADEDKLVPSTKRGHAPNAMESMSEQFGRIASNAHSRQDRAKEKALNTVMNQIEAEGLNDNKIIIVKITDPSIDSVLTGLIAINVVTHYNKPVLIVREDSRGFLSGSGRNGENSPIKDLREFLLRSGCFEYVSGHANAHGLSFHKDRLQDILDYANKALADVDIQAKEYFIDYEFDMKKEADLAEKAVLELGGQPDIWGKGVEEPLIAFININVSCDDIAVLKNNTLKISLGDMSFIQFRCPEVIEQLEGKTFVKLTILGNCQINDWGGMYQPQIKIVDIDIEDSTFDF